MLRLLAFVELAEQIEELGQVLGVLVLEIVTIGLRISVDVDAMLLGS